MPRTNDPVHDLINGIAGQAPPAYHQPAFPSQSFSQNNTTGEGISHQSEGGMTLRDYFAAHAPVDVPAWFRHKLPFEVPPLLSFRDALMLVPGAAELPIERRNEIINWSQDPVFEMDDMQLRDIGNATFRALDEITVKRRAAIDANEAALWFAWRWHYATTMIRTRGEP